FRRTICAINWYRAGMPRPQETSAIRRDAEAIARLSACLLRLETKIYQPESETLHRSSRHELLSSLRLWVQLTSSILLVLSRCLTAPSCLQMTRAESRWHRLNRGEPRQRRDSC